jgi:hypothetical protein
MLEATKKFQIRLKEAAAANAPSCEASVGAIGKRSVPRACYRHKRGKKRAIGSPQDNIPQPAKRKKVQNERDFMPPGLRWPARQWTCHTLGHPTQDLGRLSHRRPLSSRPSIALDALRFGQDGHPHSEVGLPSLGKVRQMGC